VTVDTVRDALATKADRSDVTAAHAAQAQASALAREVDAVSARVHDVAAEVARLREDARADIAAAMQAASAASAAATAAAGRAMEAPNPALPSSRDLDALRDDLSRLATAHDSLCVCVSGKADISAVNEVLETKANKATVAQALHNKVSRWTAGSFDAVTASAVVP